jgi:RNA polymerase sigma factor (sigma-70 family)
MFRARGCSAEESADLAQEAAIRAFMHIRRWGVTGAGLDPLLNRIARNLLIDRYRRAVPHIVPLDSADEIGDPTQDPSEEVARRQRRSAVQTAIRSLPTRHAKAINYSLSGLTPEEVGKELGIGRNAADALLHRARRSLREHLAPVRDGMWGLALGVKIRFDRVVRRIGISTNGGEATGALLSSSALGIAAAAMVVAVGIGGNVAGSTSSLDKAGVSKAPALVLPSTDVAKLGGSGGSVFGGTGAGSTGGSSSYVFTFGPTTTTTNRDGFSNDFSVPDPSNKNGPPLVQIQQYLWNGPGSAPPGPREPDAIDRILCVNKAACDIGSSRD